MPMAEVNLADGNRFTLRVPNTPHCPARPNGNDKGRFGSNGEPKDSRRANDQSSWNNLDWNAWGATNHWDDWDDDWKHRGWYVRCKDWLSDDHWPVIMPLRIPFTVTGNALAAVSVRPDNFIRTLDNRYFGRAVGWHGTALGYQVITHFPAPSPTYSWLEGWNLYEEWDTWRNWSGFGYIPHWSKIAHLPGTSAAGTPLLSVNMQQRGGEASGVIYIVARRNWTTDGKKAHPGLYNGILELTIIADNL